MLCGALLPLDSIFMIWLFFFFDFDENLQLKSCFYFCVPEWRLTMLKSSRLSVSLPFPLPLRHVVVCLFSQTNNSEDYEFMMRHRLKCGLDSYRKVIFFKSWKYICTQMDQQHVNTQTRTQTKDYNLLLLLLVLRAPSSRHWRTSSSCKYKFVIIIRQLNAAARLLIDDGSAAD